MYDDVWIAILVGSVWLLVREIVAETVGDPWTRRLEVITLVACWIAIIRAA